ncbi:unnamed protein product, partial (mitochondrion) [Parajaminaea phylloscopi]
QMWPFVHKTWLYVFTHFAICWNFFSFIYKNIEILLHNKNFIFVENHFWDLHSFKESVLFLFTTFYSVLPNQYNKEDNIIKIKSAGNQRYKYSLVGTSETTRGTVYNQFFWEWLGGIIDGKGSFHYKKGKKDLSLKIILDQENLCILEYIKEKLKTGTIKKRAGNKSYRYRVDNKATMKILIKNLNGYIRHSKRLPQLHEMCIALNIPLQEPVELIKGSTWFSGYFEVKGKVNISEKGQLINLEISDKTNTNLKPYQIYYNGNIAYDTGRNGYYRWSLNNTNDIIEIINCFENMKPIGSESTKLINFCSGLSNPGNKNK